MVVVFLMPNDQGCGIKVGVLAIVAVFREMKCLLHPAGELTHASKIPLPRSRPCSWRCFLECQERRLIGTGIARE